MTSEERGKALLGIAVIMHKIQVNAEELVSYVIALEKDGLELPSMKQTARTLAEIALGWEAGSDGSA